MQRNEQINYDEKGFTLQCFTLEVSYWQLIFCQHFTLIHSFTVNDLIPIALFHTERNRKALTDCLLFLTARTSNEKNGKEEKHAHYIISQLKH